MNNREVKDGLNQAFENLTPKMSENFFSEESTQNRKVMVMVEKKKKTSSVIKSLATLAAVLMIAVCGMGVYSVQVERTVDSVIALEVNPSVEIKVNKNNRVLEVIPLNEDGKIIIGDMNFKGSDLDLTVNALVGSMLREGYLSELANSILITVNNADAAKGQALQEKLTKDINNMFSMGNNGYDFALLSQTVTGDEALKKQAEEYGVSIGKAQLIQEIMKKNPTYKFEDLTGRSINDLNLILSGQGTTESAAADSQKIEKVGTASDKKYIGEEAAKEKALAHAGIAKADATFTEFKMDWERGVMVYEMEFLAGGCEYEYDVDATSGNIVKYDTEMKNPQQGNSAQGNTNPQANYISMEQAKQIAFTHAGVTEAGIFDTKYESDFHERVPKYEIDFDTNEFEYEYDINAVTGEIIANKKEAQDGHKGAAQQPVQPQQPAAQPAQGSEAAKNAALTHAGVAAGDIWDYKVEQDKEHGSTVYEIEFKAGGYEYEYEIDATTLEIRKFDKERDNH